MFQDTQYKKETKENDETLNTKIEETKYRTENVREQYRCKMLHNRY